MRVLSILVGIAYPFLAYALLTLFQPRVLILVIAGALITYALRKHKRWHLDAARRAGVLLPVVVVVTVMAIINDGRFVLFIPAVTNFALFVVFARSLVRGPSIALMIAYLQRPQLPEGAISYCRAVTIVWSVFFLLNIAISLWLAFFATLEQWALYNGCLVHVAVAVVLGGERVYRYWRFRIYEGSLLDSIFRRLFPPLQQLVLTLEDSASAESPPNAVQTRSRPS